jgi:hypothetical protein
MQGGALQGAAVCIWGGMQGHLDLCLACRLPGLLACAGVLPVCAVQVLARAVPFDSLQPVIHSVGCELSAQPSPSQL